MVKASVSFSLPDNVERLTLTGSDNIDGTGNTLNNRLIGNNGDNYLIGNEGNDQLIGKAGADTLDGGSGNDTYTVDENDTVIDSAGTDTIKSSADWILADGIEKLILTGNSNIDGTGNSLNNTITGNKKANTISGGDGDDTIIGRKGDDILTGGNGLDDFRFNDDLEGIDTITDFNVTEDIISVRGRSFDSGLVRRATISEYKFTIGTSATTADHRFIYDPDNGKLWFDIDGSNSANAIQIANLDSNLNLTHDHIYVF